jgi:hypothetical protein
MDGKLHLNLELQAYDLFEMVHLELAQNFFFLRLIDVLKTYMRDHLLENDSNPPTD